MLALARKIVAGEGDGDSIEPVLAHAQQVAAEAEAVLVDEGWVASDSVALRARRSTLDREIGPRLAPRWCHSSQPNERGWPKALVNVGAPKGVRTPVSTLKGVGFNPLGVGPHLHRRPPRRRGRRPPHLPRPHHRDRQRLLSPAGHRRREGRCADQLITPPGVGPVSRIKVVDGQRLCRSDAEEPAHRGPSRAPLRRPTRRPGAAHRRAAQPGGAPRHPPRLRRLPA